MESNSSNYRSTDTAGMSGYKGSPGWDGKNPYRYSGKLDDNAKTRSTGKSLEEILKMLNKEDVDGREGSKDPSSNEEC
jgi:hypothetical protein